jgi:hypothetical protein
MAALLRLALVVAYLAAAALPCGEADAGAASPERMRAYASAAPHAHGGAPAIPDGELRAPCPCGCDESPAGRLAASPLGAALVPAQATPALPRATHRPAPPAHARETPGQPSEPVPRAA